MIRWVYVNVKTKKLNIEPKKIRENQNLTHTYFKMFTKFTSWLQL